MTYQTLPWIAGNPLTLRIPLQKVTITTGGHVAEDYEPQSGDTVTIKLKSQRSEKSYVPKIEGNIATISDNGILPVGKYAVETLVAVYKASSAWSATQGRIYPISEYTE